MMVRLSNLTGQMMAGMSCMVSVLAGSTYIPFSDLCCANEFRTDIRCFELWSDYWSEYWSGEDLWNNS